VPHEELKKDARLVSKGVLEIGLSLIRVVGPSLATAVGLLDGELQSRRIDRLFDEVRGQVARVGAEKLDREFVNNERFQDAILAAMEAARRTSDAEKRKLVAAILVGAARIDRIPDLEADALLNAVAALSPREVMLLYTIRRRGLASFRTTDFPDYGPDLAFDLKRIEAAGFVDEQAGRTLDYTGGSYDTTATFDRMMRAVDAG
jgi:hypothetical protein